MSNPLLEVSDLSISFGGKAILNDVHFVVERGEWVSVVGKNGAGKSTLLKCLMRILRPERGRVLIDGTSSEAYSQRALARQLAYVPQATGRFSPFTVQEHVMLARYPHLKAFSAPSKADRDAVWRSLEEAGLCEFAHRPLSTLSGGERQKVYLAQAFAQGAQLLLLDEPNTFLDPKCAQDVLHLLKSANENRSITILSVTHDINSAAVVSDKIVALKNGRVEYSGDANSFMMADILESVYSTAFTFVSHPTTGLPLVLPWLAS